MVVLTTDGKDDPTTDDTAFLLRQDGVVVFVIGLGKQVDPTMLRNISGNENHVYVVPSVQGLSTVVRDVIKDLDKGKGGTLSATSSTC